MPLARERSRIEAPSYPFLQKTSVAWVRISAKRWSKRVGAEGAARCLRAETRAAVEGLAILADNSANSNVRSNVVYGKGHLHHKLAWPVSLRLLEVMGEDFALMGAAVLVQAASPALVESLPFLPA